MRRMAWVARLVVLALAAAAIAVPAVPAGATSPPQITQHPASATVGLNQSATFTATAEGATSLRWEVLTVGATAWSTVWFATQPTLAITGTATTDGRQYRAVFTNAHGSTTTDPATLTVRQAVNITTQPANALQPPGATATFTVAATGHPTPQYQWQRSTDGETWTNLVGRTSTTLSLTNITEADGAHYRAVASNVLGSVPSNAALLTVGSTANVSVSGSSAIVIGPEGSVRTITPSISGYPAPSLQWQTSVDGVAPYEDLPGETGPTLTITLTDALHGARFRVTATNIHGTSSAISSVRVGVAPAITQQPTPTTRTALVGQQVVLTAAATGTPTPTVRWQFRSGSGSYADIPGATDGTHSFTHTSATEGWYRAIFTNRAGTATTSNVDLSTGSAPTITQQPTDVTVTAGQSFTLTLTRTGNPTPVVRWQRSLDGGTTWTQVQGLTSVPYTRTANASLHLARYRAVLENSYGTVTSNVVTLTVLGAPIILTHPSDAAVVEGGTASFTASAGGDPAPSVQWQRSEDAGATWTDLAGATSPTLSLPAPLALALDGTRYRAVFTNASGTATSDPATLRVGLPVIEVEVLQPWAQRAPSPLDASEWAGPLRAQYAATASGPTTPEITWVRYGWFVGSVGGYFLRQVLGTGPTASLAAPPLNQSEPSGGWTYAAEATNEAGTVSKSFPLHKAFRPIVSVQPVEGLEVEHGGTIALEARASSAPGPPSVSWERSGDGGATWSPVSGATSTNPTSSQTSTTLVLEDVGSGDDGARYRAVFTNLAGTTATRSTLLAVAPPPAPPGPPTGIERTIGMGEVALTWTAPAGPVTRYVITPYQGQVALDPVTVTGTSAVIDGLVDGQRHFFRIAAENAAGLGPSVRVGPFTPGLPSAPRSLRATAGGGEVSLTWIEPATIPGPLVEYRIIPRLDDVALDPVVVPPTTTSAVIDGLEDGRSYRFDVVAATSAGAGPHVRSAAVVPGPPGPPTSVRAVAGGTDATVTWSPPTTVHAPITGYRITPEVGGAMLPSIVVGPGTSALIDELVPGGSYRFHVAAVTAAGEGRSARSGSVVVGVPAAPTQLKATPSSGAVTLRWIAPAAYAHPITGYRVVVRIGKATVASYELPDLTEAMISGLVGGVRYAFDVSAITAIGDGSRRSISATPT